MLSITSKITQNHYTDSAYLYPNCTQSVSAVRENFENGLYEEEEYKYWQKISTLKEKMALLERTPEPAINQAAKTLLDLSETRESTTQEECVDLVYVMIQEVGVDMAAKCMLWIRARPDYEPLFTILD